MTVKRIGNGWFIISQFIGEGAGKYLLTRTYYGYTIKQAKAQFKIAVEGEGE
jgi:hypothetical protein